MNIVGKALSPVFKFEIKALHIVHNVAIVIATIPIFTAAPLGLKGKAWEKVLNIVESGFSRMQMGQMRVLHKLGLLDSKFIDKMAGDYIDYVTSNNPEKAVNKIIKMNKSGMISDGKTAEKLRGGNFNYDPVSKQFSTSMYTTDKEARQQRAAWDQMTIWANEKAAMVKDLTGQKQKDLAVGVTRVFERIPVRAHENNEMVLSEHFDGSDHRDVIFKNVVENGQPLVADCAGAAPLSKKIASEKYPWTGEIEFLQKYASRKQPPSPKA